MANQPTLDPQFLALVDALGQTAPVSSRTVEEARAMWETGAFGEPEPVASIRNLQIPVEGDRVRARLYVPSDGPTALMVFYHGGGWVVGSLETHDLPLRALANLSGVAILSVDYRLAPEHAFPVGLEDCYSALVWAKDHLPELVGDSDVIFVGGDSAGGNLAAAVALAARDRGGPKIHGQLLLYPITDGRCLAPSYVERAEGGLLTARDMMWFWDHYAGPIQRLNPLASPALAASHRDLPPAIVVIAEFDPLRDEGAHYAEQLRAGGNEVTLLRYESLPHGFISYICLAEGAREAFSEIGRQLRDAAERASKRPG